MVSKYLKKIGRVSPPPKPKPKPRGELRTKPSGTLKARVSDKFISRRQILGGAKTALRKVPKKPGYMEGVISGATAATASALYLKNKKARKDAQAKDDKALKKAIEKHKEADKKKKDAYGKRAPKKDKNYGGR
jgi:hypothetical protein